jgi:hypothetical protein
VALSPDVQRAWDAFAARGLGAELDMKAFHAFVFAAFQSGEHPNFSQLLEGAPGGPDKRAAIESEFQREWELLAEYETP